MLHRIITGSDLQPHCKHEGKRVFLECQEKTLKRYPLWTPIKNTKRTTNNKQRTNNIHDSKPLLFRMRFWCSDEMSQQWLWTRDLLLYRNACVLTNMCDMVESFVAITSTQTEHCLKSRNIWWTSTVKPNGTKVFAHFMDCLQNV